MQRLWGIILLLPLMVTSAEARVALFRSDGFPTIDSLPIPNEVLQRVLAGVATESWSSAEDLERFAPASGDVLLLPYGSAFPLEAWPEIRDFLKHGGGLVVLGGAPFAQPVRRENGAWVAGVRQRRSRTSS